MAKFLIASIVLAIALQNTCPYGYAGKTAIASPQAHNCPLHHQTEKSDGQKKMAENPRDINHPFMLALSLAFGAPLLPWRR